MTPYETALALYNRLAQVYHWTPTQIDDQDLADVLALLSVEYKLQTHSQEPRKRRVYADQFVL